MLKEILRMSPAFGVAGFHLSAQQDDHKDYGEPEAYKLYSIALKKEDPNAKGFLIASDAEAREPCRGLQKEEQWPASVAEAKQNYRELIKTKWRLRYQFELDQQYELVGGQILSQYSDKGLALTFPDSGGAYYSLSPVGFNTQKTLAIFAMSRGYPERGDSGSMQTFEKVEGTWVPSEAAQGCAWAT